MQSPDQVRVLTDHVRARLGENVAVAVDQEGGRVQRLSEAHGFQGWLSAREFALLHETAQAEHARSMAGTLRDAGIDLNFAPCVDVDVNPTSPVIGALGRSFSSDADELTACAARVIKAHREAGIGCVLKHFPGHGSAMVDSHHDLVDVSDTWDGHRELQPYRMLAHERVGVMTGHVVLTEFDADFPASLSHKLTTKFLRGELGFEGPVFTDALDMEGVRARWSLSDSIRLGFEAGADVLVHACNSRRREYAPDVVRAMERIVSQIDDLSARSERSRERVLGLHKP